MNKFVKPLLFVGTALLAYFGLTKRASALALSLPNVEPFDGQMFTFSEAFDSNVMRLAKEHMPNIDPQLAFNILMFAFWCESGIHAQAHVNNKPGGGYTFGLHDEASINDESSPEKTHGGGLFGLIRKYYPDYAQKGVSFEEYLLSDEMYQLVSVDKWLAKSRGRIKTPQDIRMFGFAPALLGKPKDTILYKGDSSYTAHQYLDTNKDGAISLGEFEAISIKKWNDIVDKVKKKGAPLQSKYGAR